MLLSTGKVEQYPCAESARSLTSKSRASRESYRAGQDREGRQWRLGLASTRKDLNILLVSEGQPELLEGGTAHGGALREGGGEEVEPVHVQRGDGGVSQRGTEGVAAAADGGGVVVAEAAEKTEGLAGAGGNCSRGRGVGGG